MNKFEELNNRVITWADNKGILDKGTPLRQWDKMIEELLELKESLVAQNNDLEYFRNSKNEIVNTTEQVVDDLGDEFVTLIIQCKMQNLNPLKCLEIALDVIENRDGEMVNGQFVKNK